MIRQARISDSEALFQIPIVSYDEEALKSNRLRIWVYCNKDGRVLGAIEIWGGGRYITEIWGLGVVRGFRRKGIGSSLVKFIEKRLRKMGKLKIKVAPTIPSTGFYKKLGYHHLPSDIFRNGYLWKILRKGS